MKINKPLKTIFYFPHYASLLSKANLKTDHAHFSKLCLLEVIIFVKKQHLGTFELSNIDNESK